ncbi:MAG: hypothetical protein LQ342_001669 [Letrouitia transgressa]|nr:MAG: hypothetical protein LQ342_001669 [Letrouitia transgressa]
MGNLALWKATVLAASLPTNASPSDWSTSQEDIVVHKIMTRTDIDSRIGSVLSFWFDPRYPYTRWFIADPAFDAQIALKFGHLVSVARNTSSLYGWLESPRGSLALIILLDQFPRNIFRNSSDAYSSDDKALNFAEYALQQLAIDRELPLIQQVFFYLPYMHDEDIVSQDLCVAVYRDLTGKCSAGAPEKGFLDQCVDFAVRHQQVILKFGRFPARNAVLHRQSSPEEIEFLKTHPEGY